MTALLLVVLALCSLSSAEKHVKVFPGDSEHLIDGLHSMFKIADTDADGTLSLQEFSTLWEPESSKPAQSYSFLEMKVLPGITNPIGGPRMASKRKRSEGYTRTMMDSVGCYATRFCPAYNPSLSGEAYGGPFGQDPCQLVGEPRFKQLDFTAALNRRGPF